MSFGAELNLLILSAVQFERLVRENQHQNITIIDPPGQPEHMTSCCREPLRYLNESQRGTSFLSLFCINLHRFVSPITLFYSFIFKLKISVQSYYAMSRVLFVIMFTYTLGVPDLSCLFLNEPDKYVINERVFCNFIQINYLKT